MSTNKGRSDQSPHLALFVKNKGKAGKRCNIQQKKKKKIKTAATYKFGTESLESVE